MKILLYSDNHFCANSSIIRGKGKEFSKRLENQIDTLNWIEQLSVENNCDFEIHLGDFFDKSTLDSQELTALKNIKWNNKEKYFIVGNHELGDNTLFFNSLNVLNSMGKIIFKPVLLKDNKYNIFLLPYILESDRKPLVEYLKTAIENYPELYDENLPNIILTHNDIKGIKYGYFESKSGFSTAEIDSNCKLFLNGHIHNCEIFNLTNSTIYFLGNITGLNFSEDAFKYDHKAYILDTDNLSVQTYINPYAFNFYKLDFVDKDITYIEKKLSKCNNAVITLRIDSNRLNIVRELVDKLYNISEIRFISVNTISDIDKTDQQQLVKVDHIEKFKEAFLNREGNSDIIEDELKRL